MVHLDRFINGVMKEVTTEYTLHAQDLVLTSFLTVMLWIALQNLITEFVTRYLPELAMWQISAVEVFIASYGLWIVAKRKEKNGVKI